MSHQEKQNHQDKIIEQFSKQAIPFTKVAGHLNSIEVLMQLSGVHKDDFVLDVACGPGLVACEFAAQAKRVTGIDITDKMIESARALQTKKNLPNVDWKIGDVLPLPYNDDSFSVVITRYSFHHFVNPSRVLSEMIRVCQPDGRVLVADVAMPPEKVKAYDHLEILRDPSHTHALSLPEFEMLFEKSGLKNIQKAFYAVPLEVEKQLAVSFPNPGDEDKIRKLFKEDLNVNALGVNAQLKEGEIHYEVPIGVFVGRK